MTLASVFHPVVNEEPEATRGTAVFQVGEALSEATVAYQPTGSVSFMYYAGDGSDTQSRQKRFTAEEALKVEVNLQ